jgi:hypothetical protein
MWKESLRGIVLAGAVLSAACSGSATDPSAEADLPVVVSVIPASNAASVNPSSPITVAFNHSMMVGMELLVILHEGSVVGPRVPGSFSWSPDRTTLTFAPAEALKSNTSYVLHLSPNLKDTAGQGINFAGCAQRVGGQPPSGGMMGGGIMGPGWQPGFGTWGYGMTITFTTA